VSQPAAAVHDQPPAQTLNGLRDARLGLLIGLVALGLLFHSEVAAAVQTWVASTAYNHCFLVIPIAAFLIWDRRAVLSGLTTAPLPMAAVLALPFGVVWLAAERLGIMEGRQLAAIGMVEVLFLTVLGWRLWRALSGPLLYLFFLVPFGDFLTPKLQDITTWFTRHGLDMLGIPAYIDGYIIEIPEGTFYVAEACAGLRFLIASIAFGVLYALLMYRSPLRRVGFVAASIVVPIIANGIRALGIVVLGHVLGSAEAAATDHVLYGWLFFSIVILLLIVLGLPFRQDHQPMPVTKSPMPADPGAVRSGLVSGLAVAAAAAVGPVLVLGLNQASATPNVALRPLDLAPACVNQGTPAIPATGSPGRAIVQTVNCDGTAMNIEFEVFPSHSTAAPVNAERRRLTRSPDADDVSEAPVATKSGAVLPGWRFVRADSPGAFVAAVGLWVEGEPATPGLRMRWQMAKSSLTGATYPPVLVTITPVADWRHVDAARRHQLERRIAAILEARPDLGEQIRSAARMAP
jgi:exosortase A